MNENRYAVIMAGGRGERFWPQSRLRRPKHLLPIVGDYAMLTQTVQRIGDLVPASRVLVITNAEQVAAVREICPMLPHANIIAEPVGRDTAAAVGLATLLVKQRCPQATFAMLPADHVIHDTAAFRSILETAFQAAEAEPALVTVGIHAAFAATGYGYIQRGDCIASIAGRSLYSVRAFKEKPDAATAQSYVNSGEYYWNAGMFIWQVAAIAGEFARQNPRLWAALGAIESGIKAGESLEQLLATHYPALEKISIDYAVMENAAAVQVLESEFDWDDVGEWPAVARHFPADAAGNVCRGRVLVEQGSNNIVIAGDTHTVTMVGVDDLIVVHTGDATLVCRKDRAQDIKKLVKRMEADPSFAALL